MKLGTNIFTFRKAAGLSQEKLAEKIGVTRQTISNWELGETAPNPEQLILLSKSLNKSIDELVGNEFTPSGGKEHGRQAEGLKPLCVALAVLCGSVAGIWAFSANRFRTDEIMWIVGVSAAAGVCLGVVCRYLLQSIQRGDT